MRNPVRLKNFRGRYAAWYGLAAVVLVLSRPEPAGFLVGSALVVLGVVLRGWGAGYLVKNDRLSVAGPYAYLRHPLYAGMLLLAMGFGVMLGGLLTPVALLVLGVWFFGIYFPRKEPSESQRLEALHGEDFRSYRTAVPALWPRMQPYRVVAGLEQSDSVSERWKLESYSQNNELGALIAILVAWAVLFGRLVAEA